MAINGNLVIDAVVHAFDCRPEQLAKTNYAETFIENVFRSQAKLIPEPHRMSHAEYFDRMDADTLASALFHESWTDVAVFHPIPAWGVFHNLSPAEVAIDIRSRYPGRMYLYGAVSPLEGAKALDDLDQQVEEWGIEGVKLYPLDIIDGVMHGFGMNDHELCYPLYEKCRSLGIKTIAVHKSIPLGTAPMDPFRPGDLDYAARDFPDLNFEVVHGGLAFLDESAYQLKRFPNVYINLESTAQLLIKHPMKFARIVGELLLAGPQQVLWGTGSAGTGHAAPILQAFADFTMPEELIDGYGYPEITDELRAGVLGGNFAAAHGWDLEAVAQKIAGDEVDQTRANGLAEPWATRRLPAMVGA